MLEKYKGSCEEMCTWIELVFPEKGSLSTRQLDTLKEKLEQKEEQDAEKWSKMPKKEKKVKKTV